MLESLQAWVADYYRRDDQWSYVAHRRVFDAHTDPKTEYSVLAPVAVFDACQKLLNARIGTLGLEFGHFVLLRCLGVQDQREIFDATSSQRP